MSDLSTVRFPQVKDNEWTNGNGNLVPVKFELNGRSRWEENKHYRMEIAHLNYQSWKTYVMENLLEFKSTSILW